MDISKFFIQDNKNKQVRFVGDKLQVYIPKRYENSGFLKIGKHISALGIFRMKINDSIEVGFQLPAVIHMEYQDTSIQTIDEITYMVGELHKGDRFMTENAIIQDSNVLYFMWSEYLSLGHLPEFITYDSILTMTDDLKEVADVGLSVNHALLEIIYAQIFRSADNKNVFYRHTDMSKKPSRVTLRDVAYGPTSTHGKIIGSYADEGRTSAMLNQADTNDTLEDFFRS